MESSNKTKIKGDNNKVIQGLKAGGNITIVYGKDADPKLIKEKEKAGNKIEELVEQLREIEENAENSADNASDFKEPDNRNYKKVNWRRLLRALKGGKIILFIGPDISVDEDGNSIHEKTYKSFIERYSEVEYLEEEGFFSPKLNTDLLYDIQGFYEEDFPDINTSGRQVLESFVQIPFSLIISLCPDDTIHKIYQDFDLEHSYLYYNESKQETDDPKIDNPVIYNILGNIEEDFKYVFTYEDLYKYLKEINIPPNIKKKIQETTDFLFIGFDFNKWYYRLLLFILKFDEKFSDKLGMNIEKKAVAEKFEKFIKKQFNITSVHDDYVEFIGWLVQHVKKDGELAVRDLNQIFISSKFKELERLSKQVSDAEKLVPLEPILKEAEELGKKINSFKQVIS